MPFHLPFKIPYLPRHNYNYPYFQQYVKLHSTNTCNSQSNPNNYNQQEKKSEDCDSKQNNNLDESSEYFFEIFGIKLYFDDILILCLLFFLYTEGVKDQELFLCLILLLIS